MATCVCEEGRRAAERAAAEAEKRREAERAEAEREDLALRRRESGLGARQFGQTFDTFRPDKGSCAAFEAALSFAGGFVPRHPEDPAPEGGGRGLMLVGGTGVGKSHLAAAIANHILNTGGHVTFRTVPELLGELKLSYGFGGDGDFSLLQRFKRTALLILDDLGKEQATEWSLARLFEIINSRYENCMPVVVTANYSLPALEGRLSAGGDRTVAKAVVSRLAGMTRCVGMVGKDRRTEK